jgi:hypothetical protein
MIAAEVKFAVCHIFARYKIDPAGHAIRDYQLVNVKTVRTKRIALTETVLRAFWRTPGWIRTTASNQVAHASRSRDPAKTRCFTDVAISAARTHVLIQKAREIVPHS